MHATDTMSRGLSPLEDQQLAGVIMWVPAGTVYAGAILVFVALWVRGAGETRKLVWPFSVP